MRILLATLAVLIAVAPAGAISRYNAWTMSCDQTRATVRAEGVVLSRGRRVGTAEGRLTDGQGRLLAHGTTTCLIFPV